MLLIAFASLPAAPAGASDAKFSQALSAAGCTPNRVTIVRKEQGVQIYEVNCAGNPPESVGVVCAKNTCTVSSGSKGVSGGSAEQGDTLPAGREAVPGHAEHQH